MLPVARLRRAQSSRGQLPVKFADNIVVPNEKLPDWMIELAEQVKLIEPGALLPTGVIVGSAVIEKVVEVASGQTSASSVEPWPVASGQSRDRTLLATDNSQLATLYEWHLVDVERAKRFRKPKGHPQPVWFTPF